MAHRRGGQTVFLLKEIPRKMSHLLLTLITFCLYDLMLPEDSSECSEIDCRWREVYDIVLHHPETQIKGQKLFPISV